MYSTQDYETAQQGGIVISAYNELLQEKVAGDEFCWGFYLRIENNSHSKISLLGKNISITDTKGHSVSLKTEGFGGQLPELEPGEVFEFEDYATSKSSAVLCGSCKIADSSHKIMDVEIPVLSLIANDNQQRIFN